MHLCLRRISQGLLPGLASLLLFPGNPAIAADRIVLRYLIFEEAISVSELTALATTGEVSPTLETYFSAAKQDPQAIRSTLTRPIPVDALLLDRVLNHSVGEQLLDQVGEMIHTSNGRADRQALRSALVLAAMGDNQITLLEVIQKYPTNDIYVEGDRIVQTYAQLKRISQLAQDLEELIRVFQ